MILVPGATGTIGSEVVRLLSARGHTVRAVARSVDGQPPWLVAALLAIAGYQRAGGPTESVTDTVEQITGRRARTIRQFAQDYQAEFHRQC